MKYVIILIVVCLTASSCKKDTEFRFSDSATFTIPATATAGSSVIDDSSVGSSSQFQFEVNSTNAKNVKEIKLERLVLTVQNPLGNTFGFLNSVHLYIAADGLAEVEIAYLNDIPPAVGGSIELITTGIILDEYIKKNTYKLRIETVTDEVLTEDVEVKSDMTFFVKAILI